MKRAHEGVCKEPSSKAPKITAPVSEPDVAPPAQYFKKRMRECDVHADSSLILCVGIQDVVPSDESPSMYDDKLISYVRESTFCRPAVANSKSSASSNVIAIVAHP